MSNELKKSNVVITGADGFIGSHLTESLVKLGCNVTAFTMYNSLNSWGWLDTIDKKIIDKELELVTEELKNSGKPEEIAKKISLGKMNKFKEENALLTQAWVMEPKKKVQDILKELAVNDLKIKEFSRIKIGE